MGKYQKSSVLVSFSKWEIDNFWYGMYYLEHENFHFSSKIQICCKKLDFIIIDLTEYDDLGIPLTYYHHGEILTLHGVITFLDGAGK